MEVEKALAKITSDTMRKAEWGAVDIINAARKKADQNYVGSFCQAALKIVLNQ